MESHDVFMNPFLMWSRLVSKAGKAAIDSAPSASNRRKFALMDQEQFAAASETALGVGLSMLVMNQHFVAFVFKQMLLLSAALMSITASRTAAESSGRQSKRVLETMTSAAAAPSRLSGAAEKVAQSALKPAPRCASGNAARLRRMSS